MIRHPITPCRISAAQNGRLRHTGHTCPGGQCQGQQEVEIGLSYYIARFYDPVIAHFIQPDSLIPQASASASYDRYAYVSNNPIRFNDPSGNYACADFDGNGKCIQEPKKKTIVSRTLSLSSYIGNVPVIDKRESSLTVILKNGVKPPDLTY